MWATICRDLQQLHLVSASGTALAGGCRCGTAGMVDSRCGRRDGGFGAAVDQDLVLAEPVRGFSIPREAQVEQYYVGVRRIDAAGVFAVFERGFHRPAGRVRRQSADRVGRFRKREVKR